VLHAVLHDASAKSDSDLDLDLQFTKVGEDQQITAPAHAKPFAELLKATGALGSGGLGGLLGGTSGLDPSAAGGGAGNVDKYARCVNKANGDSAKARKCAALLTG
jgi:hypothetical protein